MAHPVQTILPASNDGAVRKNAVARNLALSLSLLILPTHLCGCGLFTEQVTVGHQLLRITGTVELDIAHSNSPQRVITATNSSTQSSDSCRISENGKFHLQLTIKVTGRGSWSEDRWTGDASRIELVVMNADNSVQSRATLDSLIGYRAFTKQDLESGVTVRWR